MITLTQADGTPLYFASDAITGIIPTGPSSCRVIADGVSIDVALSADAVKAIAFPA